MSDEINKWCDEIIEAGEKATPRPWAHNLLCVYESKPALPDSLRGNDVAHLTLTRGKYELEEANAEYIVLACNSAPALAAALKRAEFTLTLMDCNCPRNERIDRLESHLVGCNYRVAREALSDICAICAAATKPAR